MPETRALVVAVLSGLLTAQGAAQQRPAVAAQPDLVITGATLIDGTGAPPRAGTTIVVRAGRITAVAPDGQAELPAQATVINAAGKYVMPGLVDLHVHATNETTLRQLLFYGVTSVLQMGGTGAGTDAIRTLRSRRAAGEIQAPYIYGTGGHLTLQGAHPIYTVFPPTVRAAADSMAAATPLDEPVDLYPLGIGVSLVRTEEAARKAVRERAAGGMDAIKITVESGPTMFGDDHPQMSVAMIRAITDETSRQGGLPVFAHVSSVDELEAAIAGGVRTLAHAVAHDPVPPGPEHVRLLVENGVRIVSTLALHWSGHRFLDNPALLDDPLLRQGVAERSIASFRQSSMQRMERAVGSFRRTLPEVLRHVGEAHRAGVTIALGTDTEFYGFSAHVEMELLAQAGLTPDEVIQAATRRGAELLGRAADFGTVETGRRADLLILDANPLTDIRNTRSLEAVISEGRLVDRAALLPDQ